MAQYSKRGRNSNRRRQGGNNNPNRSMDSQGPEVKIRGTATQIHDKYQALARDAFSSGDRIRGESLMQHAEHYYRLMKSMQPEKKDEPKREGQSDQQPQADTNGEGAPEAAAEEAKAADTDEVKPAAEASEPPAIDEEGVEPKPRRRRRRRKADEGEATGEDKASEASSDKPALEEAAAE